MAAVRLLVELREREQHERQRERDARSRLRRAQRARMALWKLVAGGRHPGDEVAVSDALRAADEAVAFAVLDVEHLAVPA